MAYALITGASGGIGKEMAIILAKEKIDLLLVARDEAALKVLANTLIELYNIKVKYLSIDLSISTSPAAIAKWCNEKHYPIKYLINNAGYGLSGAFEQYSPAEYSNMISVNINALTNLTAFLLPILQQQSKAYILNVASTAAYQAVPGLSVYAATKAYVLSFSRGLRYELRNKGIIVSCVCPGPTDTGFASRAKIGEKGLKAASKLNMSAASVAQIAIRAMFNEETEVITGTANKIGALFTRLLPKELIERIAGSLYV